MNIVIKIWKLLPGILGLLQQVLPPLKEVIIIVIRLVDIVTIKDGVADAVIDKVNAVYDKVYGAVEKIKNFLLGE
jgi:hypothetical protein